MRTQKRQTAHHLVLLVLTSLLIALLSPTMIAAKTFYRLGWSDGQDVYYRVFGRPIVQGNKRSNPIPLFMTPFSDSLYYPELRAAGFTFTTTHILEQFQNSGLYCGIRVFEETWGEIQKYSHAQYKFYDIGGPDAYQYYKNPVDPHAGVTSPFGTGYIFHSDRKMNRRGWLLNHSLWNKDQVLNERIYFLEAKIKSSDWTSRTDTLFSVTFGIRRWAHKPPAPDSFAYDTTCFLVMRNDVTEGKWDTLRLSKYLNSRGVEKVVNIYWYGSSDLDLDWIRIFDQTYWELAMADPITEDSVKNVIQAEARKWNLSFVEGFWLDEPWPCQWNALKIVDDYISEVAGKRILVDFLDRRSDWVEEYIDLVRPDVIGTNLYPLETFIQRTSDATSDTDSTTLQTGWDHLMYWKYTIYWERYWDDASMIRGLRPFAEVANKRGVQWFTFVGVGNQKNYGFRESTANEILCNAYLSFCLGAKGIAYYMTPPWFQVYVPPPAGVGPAPQTVPGTYTPQHYDSTWQVTGGLFDLVKKDGMLPDSADFPFVFHTGYLAPNYKYYAVKELHQELDRIDTVLLQLDWVESFCTKERRSYDYIDSVWTVGDDQNGKIDSTFIQVGVFQRPGEATTDKYLMLVNRRCLDSESRTVHVRFRFGAEYGGKCLTVTDYIGDSSNIICTDENGVVKDMAVALKPGLGKLLNIIAPQH